MVVIDDSHSILEAIVIKIIIYRFIEIRFVTGFGVVLIFLEKKVKGFVFQTFTFHSSFYLIFVKGL